MSKYNDPGWIAEKYFGEETMINRYNFSKTENNGTIYTQCSWCKVDNEIIIDIEAYAKWVNREELIQKCFPHLLANEREIIQTGIHPECWNDIFPEEE